MKFFILFFTFLALLVTSVQAEEDELPMDRSTRATAIIYCHNPTAFAKIFVKAHKLRIILAKKSGDSVAALLVNDHGSAMMVLMRKNSVCVYGAIKHGTLSKNERLLLDKGVIKPPVPTVEA